MDGGEEKAEKTYHYQKLQASFNILNTINKPEVTSPRWERKEEGEKKTRNSLEGREQRGSGLRVFSFHFRCLSGQEGGKEGKEQKAYFWSWKERKMWGLAHNVYA